MVNLIKKYKALSFGVFTVVILCLIIFFRSPKQENKSQFDKLETSTPTEINSTVEEMSQITEENKEVVKIEDDTSNKGDASDIIENPFITNTKNDKDTNKKVENFENILNNTITTEQPQQENTYNTNNEKIYSSLEDNSLKTKPQEEIVDKSTNEIPAPQLQNYVDEQEFSNHVNTLDFPIKEVQQEPKPQPQQEPQNNLIEQNCQVVGEKVKYKTGEERAKDIKESEAMLFDYNGLIVNSYKQLEYLNLQKVFSFSEKENCINIVNEKEWCLNETRYGTDLIKIDKTKKLVRIKILKDSVYVNLTINDKEIQ